ncbi:hypothetical protein STEG23_011011 [Scotinomys teguina]
MATWRMAGSLFSKALGAPDRGLSLSPQFDSFVVFTPPSGLLDAVIQEDADLLHHRNLERQTLCRAEGVEKQTIAHASQRQDLPMKPKLNFGAEVIGMCHHGNS